MVCSVIELGLIVFKTRHQRGVFLWGYFGQLIDIVMIRDESEGCSIIDMGIGVNSCPGAI